MANALSKTQIDRLGDRLRKDDITEADLRLLDEYRRSFGKAYELVVGAIQSELGLEPTGRPTKSTTSISEKLLRESIRLTQVQDIAGCRLIVSDVAQQHDVIESLCLLFKDAAIVDRRVQPSHSYRAVHIIVKRANKLVEIQVRTSLQHAWAELSEKLSDVIDPAIKYGKGNQSIVDVLSKLSAQIAQVESQEVRLGNLEKQVSGMLLQGKLARDKEEELIGLQRDIQNAQSDQRLIREESLKTLRRIIEGSSKRRSNGISD